ncbi:trehalose utilization-domain-containing protein [Rhypophila decipiens]|uniref:Trehalose utilization-domain-containing protein n=1 Tax=Rhypophila decipiens TaxID=261697 RepID=A0AAN7B3E2_9PEZI|nr:trehalose utilization-domain-containing protein [Rhypophila decipiens]
MTESQTRTRTEAGFKVLVFSRTTPSGYRHASIEAGIRGIKRLAEDVSRQSASVQDKLAAFTVDATEDASVFDSATGLEQYKVIVLLSNSGDDCLDEGQLLNFRKWVEAGGAVVGVHCASFCCIGPGPGHEWYGDLLGGVFADHPVPQDGLVKAVAEGILGLEGPKGLTGDFVDGHVKGRVETEKKDAPSHPIHIYGEIGMEYLLEAGWGTSSSSGDLGQKKCHGDEGAILESERRNAKHVADKEDDDQGSRRKDLEVGTSLRWHDEWYNFVSHPRDKLLSSYKDGTTGNFTILLTVEESTYSGGKHGKDHPVAWCQEFRTGGRCFYTALGHFDEAYGDPWFMGHLLGGIYWAAKVI